jgi:penicillin-binding protein 1C
VKITTYIKNNKTKYAILAVLLIWYYFSLPKQLFNEPTSTVIESVEGELLGAQIAEDEQWVRLIIHLQRFQ